MFMLFTILLFSTLVVMDISSPESEAEMSTAADGQSVLLSMIIMCIVYLSIDLCCVSLTASMDLSKRLLSIPGINVLEPPRVFKTNLLADKIHGEKHFYVKPYSDLYPWPLDLLTVSENEICEALFKSLAIYLCLNVLYKSNHLTNFPSSSPCITWYKILEVYVQTCLVQPALAQNRFMFYLHSR